MAGRVPDASNWRAGRLLGQLARRATKAAHPALFGLGKGFPGGRGHVMSLANPLQDASACQRRSGPGLGAIVGGPDLAAQDHDEPPGATVRPCSRSTIWRSRSASAASAVTSLWSWELRSFR